jgi:DNA (cytosine-5)-methyltransferase 1
MRALTHVDLFSGVGGFKLAAEWNGFETLAFAEIEPFNSRVLRQCWPEIPNVGDVRQCANFAPFAGRTTVVTGGFPCQPASLAGDRRGAGDHRWLWPAMRDVIALVRPAWVIGENVPGIVSMGLDDCLADLESLGYSAQPFAIPAVGVDARHLRERIWILAHADGHGQHEQAGRVEESGLGIVVGREALPDARGAGREELHASAVASDAGHAAGRYDPTWRRWRDEPGILRVADGIPHRAHRITALGNAIVPQAVAPFFYWIAQAETQRASHHP